MISHLKKTRSKQHPTETVTNTDYADDLALLINTPTQVEFLKQATRSLGLYINANQTVYAF